MPLGALAVPGDLIINSGASVTQATNFNASIANTSNVTINGGGVLTLTGSNTLANLIFNNDGGTATPTVTTGGTLVPFAPQQRSLNLLAEGDDSLVDKPLADRRKRLEKFWKSTSSASLHLSPATTKRAEALGWLKALGGAGLDGLIAKRKDEPYHPGERAGMVFLRSTSRTSTVHRLLSFFYRIRIRSIGLGALAARRARAGLLVLA
jgi:hypothetical protein